MSYVFCYGSNSITQLTERLERDPSYFQKPGVVYAAHLEGHALIFSGIFTFFIERNVR